MTKKERSSKPSDYADIIVILAVLATGNILIIAGHMTPEALIASNASFAALYGAWKHWRTPR